ncbi:tyrosine-type recombinase/integrase [[Clostridium] innocuum]|nr:tyrosine-type recombinase/integrase [[Clostridium] innocuum]
MKRTILTLHHLNRFHKKLIQEEKSKATIEKYMRDVRRFYEYLPQEQAVTKEAVMLYKQSLLDTYKPASANSMLVSVNLLLSSIGLADCRVKLHKLQKKIFHDDKHNLTRKEYERLLAAAKKKGNDQLVMLLQTICSTGIRVSEIRFITVEALKKGSAVIRNKGKIREILFPAKLKQTLIRYCRDREITNGAVFLTSQGNHLDRSNVWRMMKNLCAYASVDPEKVFPHNLRHLFAYTFYRMEKDLVRLADLLGHSSIETTRIYTKTSIQACQKMIDRMALFSIGYHTRKATT